MTGLWRFRPDKNFRPYVGAGIGYSFVEFDSSDELIELSENLEASSARQTRLLRNNLGGIITGKAVYEGRFTVVEAIEALARL